MDCFGSGSKVMASVLLEECDRSERDALDGEGGTCDSDDDDVEGDGETGLSTGLGGIGDVSAHLYRDNQWAGAQAKEVLTLNSKFLAVGVTTSISCAVEALCMAFGPGEANDTLPTRTSCTTVRDYHNIFSYDRQTLNRV